MASDFSAATIARLEDAQTESVILVNSPPPPTQALILGGNSTWGAFLIGNQSAGKALALAAPKPVEAAATALRVSGKSFWRAVKTLRYVVPR
jgi:hypothetical protein